jgi:perosamine synthetase
MKKYFLHEPKISLHASKNINRALKKGWVSSSGEFTLKFEKKLNSFVGQKCFPVNSGTSALHLCLVLSNVKADDEVLVPTITFIATINAVLYVNAKPVFFDCEKNNPNIDVDKLIFFLKNNTYSNNNGTYNKKTKRKISAVILTHVFGNPVDLNKIKLLLKKKKIKLIEDAAEAFGSYSYDGKHCGTHGDFSALSFNANKIITTAAGGAVICKNIKNYKKLKMLATQSKKDPIFFIHNEMGFNYSLSNIQSAIGLSQLISVKSIILKKKKIYLNYKKNFDSQKNFNFLKIKNKALSNHWLNCIILNKSNYNLLSRIVTKLNDNNVQVRPLWYPCHKQEYLKKFQKYQIKNANKIYKSLICLPSSSFLSKHDINYISNKVIEVINSEI